MLGELIYEVKGKRISRRVLEAEPSHFKVEVTLEDSGKMLGMDSNGFGTYWSSNRPDGSLYGEGQGVILTAHGDQASWKGSGIGKLKAGGAVSYRGIIYIYSASPKLARLNDAGVVFEFEVDGSGNTHTKGWEWK